MRKLGIAVGALVALLVIAMAAIPLFVNVDKYRPQITEAVNHDIDGTLELGHLSLSLWGQVRVEIAGLSLKDSQGRSVVSVRSAYFHVPFLPLLSGSPVIDLDMDSPVVNVVKDRAGKLNLMTLVKTGTAPQETAGFSAPAAPAAPAAPSAPSASSAAPQSGGAQNIAVPAIAANARLGFDLRDATVEYADETKGLTTQMKDLNIVAQNLSLTHPSQISIWSVFDTQLGSSLTVKGPGRVDLRLSPEVGGGKLVRFALDGKVDLDGLAIAMPGIFEKKSGVPANVELSLSGTPQEVEIKKADVDFFNAVIHSSGSVSALQTNPIVHYMLKSNDIELKPWTELIPMLSQYELGGKAKLFAELGGPSTKLAYEANIGVDGLTAKAPMLKAQPRIDGQIVIATDQLQRLALTMTAPGNELKISGKVLSFTAPQATFEVTSGGMDLDQLVDFQAMKARKKTESAAEGGFAPSAYAEKTAKAPEDLDALLDPIRANPLIQKLAASLNVNLKMLKAQNVRVTDLAGKFYFKDLAAGLDHFAMKVFGGTIKASMACQLRPRQPTYKFSTDVSGLDLGQAMESQVAMFKNTATGKASFEVAGEGASFNPAPAEAQLKAKGSMKITDAKLDTVDVGKMAADGIMGSLSRISSKVPSAGKSFTPPHGASQYQLISSDFGISGGKFTAPNLVGKAVPRKGIDFKGSAVVGLKDQSLDAKLEITDTYDLLQAKEFQGGILCERGKPFVMPVGVGCTLQSPCYSYQDTGEFLMKVAMNNMFGQAKSQAQSQIANQIQNALGGQGGGTPDIKKALKGLGGLFGN